MFDLKLTYVENSLEVVISVRIVLNEQIKLVNVVEDFYSLFKVTELSRLLKFVQEALDAFVVAFGLGFLIGF